MDRRHIPWLHAEKCLIAEGEAEPASYTIIERLPLVRHRYDVAPLLETGTFRRIQDADAFASVDVDEMGGVVWKAGADLSRDNVYLAGDPV